MALIKKKKLPGGVASTFPPKTLSVCMIVKNEEATLAECLETTQTFADEIVLVDTGSTDRTKEIARAYKAKVIESDWRDDFSYSRNISLAHAKCAWVLWLDADDRVTESGAAAINRLKREIEEPAAGFGLKIKNIQQSGIGEEFLQIRLFPNDPRLRFEKRVHEQISTSLLQHGYQILYLSEIEILHTGYQDETLKRKKALRNRAILEADMPNFPDDPNYLSAYGDTFAMCDEWEKAAEVYESVMHLPRCREKQSDIYEYMPVTIALAFKHLNRFDEALQWIEKGLTIRPDKIELFFLGGEMAWESGNGDRAEYYYQKTIDAPERMLSTSTDFISLKAKARMRTGHLLLKKGNIAEARRHFETILAGPIPFFDTPASIGETYYAEGKILDAIRYYSDSLLQYPGKDLRAYERLAEISEHIGKKDDALGFCEKGISFFPTSKELLERAKRLYRERGDMARYLEVCSKLNG